MQIRISAAVLVTLFLGGCASVPVLPLQRPSADAGGEVVIFRESAFAAGGVGLAVGAGTSAFAILSNAEKVRALLPAGEHEIFVQARSAEPSKVRIRVSPRSTICLRTSSSSGTYAKAAVPIVLMATGYHFYVDEVPCPPGAELAKYKDVLVRYE